MEQRKRKMAGKETLRAFERMIEAPKSTFVIKKSMWIYSADGTICSNCGYKLETTGLLSYCPHCNANMKEGILVHPGKIYTNTEIEE